MASKESDAINREPERLQALKELGILDSPREAVFDHITAIASRLFSTDIACITLVDDERFYFKSTHGCDVVETPRESGLCDITVDTGKTRVVRDTQQDPSTNSHSMVCAAPFVKFYAGAPLITPDGHPIGTLCILNSEHIEFSKEDETVLEELAHYVMFHILHRKSIADERRHEAAALHADKRAGLGLLAGGIAHDLNNYLMGIAGNASLLQATSGGDGSDSETLRNIVEATERATALTNQLMVYAGQRNPKTEAVDFASLLLEVVRLTASSLPDGISLQSDIGNGDFVVLADPTQLRQVVVNLITNAQEACEDRTGKIEVSLSHCEMGNVCLEVKDNGAGMDERTRQSLFEPFFSTKLTGRGLGMAIVEQVVNMHGGEIVVASELGQGTTMTISLPLVSGVLETVKTDRQVQGISAAKKARHMLIVDDEDLIRDFLQSAASYLGLEIRSAVSGPEALDILSSGPTPDLILIDAGMPGMSGEDTLAAVQANHPGIMAIVMSGHDLTDVRDRFSRCRVSHFIQKPFGLETLASVLDASEPAEKMH